METDGAAARALLGLPGLWSWFGRVSFVWPTLNAYLQLRNATRHGRRVTLHGRARIVNGGTMVFGERIRLEARVATLELATLPGGHLEVGNNVFINSGTSIC